MSPLLTQVIVVWPCGAAIKYLVMNVCGRARVPYRYLPAASRSFSSLRRSTSTHPITEFFSAGNNFLNVHPVLLQAVITHNPQRSASYLTSDC